MVAAPCGLKTDNLEFVAMLAKPHGANRRKFIDLMHHMLQKLIHNQDLLVLHIRDFHQKEDVLMKVLQRFMFTRQCTAISC